MSFCKDSALQNPFSPLLPFFFPALELMIIFQSKYEDWIRVIIFEILSLDDTAR